MVVGRETIDMKMVTTFPSQVDVYRVYKPMQNRISGVRSRLWIEYSLTLFVDHASFCGGLNLPLHSFEPTANLLD